MSFIAFFNRMRLYPAYSFFPRLPRTFFRRGLLRDKAARHNPQPPLDQAAALSVTRPVGSNEVIDLRRSPVDAAPIRSWEFALYQLTQPAKPVDTPPSLPRVLSGENTTTTWVPSRDFDAATVGF